MRTLLAVCSLVLVAEGHCLSQAHPVEDSRPNIVCIVVDDMGVDMVRAYGEAPVQAPCTPNIDRIAARGVLFRNAWTNPVCSSSRAQILTGLHSFRTGIGEMVKEGRGKPGLSLLETTIPEALAGYDTSAVGKWHLASTSQGLLHPLSSGFDFYAGSMYNLGAKLTGSIPGCFPTGYLEWEKNVNGTLICASTYATTDTTDDAIARAQAMQPPWFLYVAFNAVHHPLPSPPANLCQSALCPVSSYNCPSLPSDPAPARYKAVAQAMDAEIGRMLDAIWTIDPDVYVILISDNGSAQYNSEGPPGGCFDPKRAKGTLFESGVNVPLIIAGPEIVSGEVRALVSSTDIFATVTELAGASAQTPDSFSLVPYLRGVGVKERVTVYAERFVPNGIPLNPVSHKRAIRNERFKLIRSTYWVGPKPITTDMLFDLVIDPCESVDLFPTLQSGTFEHLNYTLLVAELQDGAG